MSETTQFSREQELTIILDLVPREESWYNQFKLEHPSIGTDLDTFRVNKQCGCRKRLVTYVNSNEQKVRDTFYNWKNNNPDILKNHLELTLINKKEGELIKKPNKSIK